MTKAKRFFWNTLVVLLALFFYQTVLNQPVAAKEKVKAVDEDLVTVDKSAPSTADAPAPPPKMIFNPPPPKIPVLPPGFNPSAPETTTKPIFNPPPSEALPKGFNPPGAAVDAAVAGPSPTERLEALKKERDTLVKNGAPASEIEAVDEDIKAFEETLNGENEEDNAPVASVDSEEGEEKDAAADNGDSASTDDEGNSTE